MSSIGKASSEYTVGPKKTLNEKGEYVIPASRRPDGTWRKEKKVKEGWVPQEEVGVFKTIANTGKPRTIPGLAPQAPTKKAQLKAIVPKAAKECEKIENISTSVSGLSLTENGTENPEISIEKKLKNYRKKLREIIDLESNISSGKLSESDLTPEQRQKINRKSLIESEIQTLEIAAVNEDH